MAAVRASCSRRRLLRGVGAGLAAGALGGVSRLAGAAGAIEQTALSPELTLLQGAGGNMLALATGVGLVVVDSGVAGEADDLRATLAEVSGQSAGQSIAALFNTHWHPQQVGANALLGAAGAAIHAQVKTQQRLAYGYYRPTEERYEAPLPAAGVPAHTFYDTGDFVFGDSPVTAAYLIEAHTDGDIAVMFPEQNVIAIGGVISPAQDPEFDWFGGGWIGGRLDAYDLLLANSDAATRFVPASGPVVSQAELRAERALLQEVFDIMVERIRLGETPEDIHAAGALEGLSREFNDPYRLIYDLHKGLWAHHNKLTHDIV